MRHSIQFTKRGVLLSEYLFKWATGLILMPLIPIIYISFCFSLIIVISLVYILKLPIKSYNFVQNTVKGLS